MNRNIGYGASMVHLTNRGVMYVEMSNMLVKGYKVAPKSLPNRFCFM